MEDTIDIILQLFYQIVCGELICFILFIYLALLNTTFIFLQHYYLYVKIQFQHLFIPMQFLNCNTAIKNCHARRIKAGRSNLNLILLYKLYVLFEAFFNTTNQLFEIASILTSPFSTGSNLIIQSRFKIDVILNKRLKGKFSSPFISPTK